jgi:hypothetical protein
MTYNPLLFTRLPYEVETDFTPWQFCADQRNHRG